MRNMNASQMFSYSVSIKKSILSHTSWIQTRACSQQHLLTLIIMRRGKRTHPSVHSPLLYPCTPKLVLSLFPIIFNGSWFKRVGCAITAHWSCTHSFCCLRDTESKKGIPRTRKVPAPHCPTPCSAFTGLCGVLSASLDSVHFHGAFLNRIFLSSPLGVHLRSHSLPKLTRLHASPLQTELLKGINYIIILQPSFPYLSPLSSQNLADTCCRTPEFLMPSISKHTWSP